MLGAICGDILGSTYEFGNEKSYDIPLLNEEDHFTDDTVLTLAVAKWLMDDIEDCYFDDEKLKAKLAVYFCDFVTNQYIDFEIAYGLRFIDWVEEYEKNQCSKPYSSYGNGCIMRLSPIAWYFDTIEEVQRFAKIQCDITHNHPESHRAVAAIASSIFLARKGYDKQYILDYVRRLAGYPLNKKIEELRESHEFNAICQATVPEAMLAFFESTDFESAVRLSISYGGDSDTIACVAGSIAEAYYNDIPDIISNHCVQILTDHGRMILSRFRALVLQK